MSLGLLVLTAGKQEGKVLDIKLPQFLIGRDPQCHLRPASPLISKRHCALIQRDGKVFLRDFGSTNGTLLNDEPITGEVELNNNDRVKVGPIEFEVRIQPSILRTPTPAPATRPVGTPTPAPPTKKPESAAPANPVMPTAQPIKPPTKADTPLPATLANKTPPASTSSTGKSGGDEDIAAMLLSLDDGESAIGSGEVNTSVPEGSTVFDMKVPPELAALNKPGEEKKDQAKPQQVGDTRSAAARILEKMTKRPRN